MSIMRISLIAWTLWGVALGVWVALGEGEGMQAWQTLFVLWVLNGGLLWLLSRSGK